MEQMKLSKATKEQLVNAAVEKGFSVKEKEILNRLNEEVFQYYLKQGKKLASDIPKGFEEYIRVTSEWHVYYYHKRNIYGTLPKQLCSSPYSNLSFTEDEALKLFKEYKKLENLNKDKEEFESAVYAIVNSCTTDTQLKETAPEIYDLLPIPIKTIDGALVDIATVNKVRDFLKDA